MTHKTLKQTTSRPHKKTNELNNKYAENRKVSTSSVVVLYINMGAGCPGCTLYKGDVTDVETFR